MRLWYTIDGKDIDGSDYIDDDEVRDFIFKIYSPEDILIDYLNYVYPKEPQKFKDMLEADWAFDGSVEAIENMDELDQKDLAEEVYWDVLDTDIYDDEINDHFERRVIRADEEAEADYAEYIRDPYAYYGLRKSDFY